MKGNRKGFLNDEYRVKIAKYKGKHPGASLESIAQLFKVTERQVFNAVHKHPEHSGVEKRDFTDEKLLKKIAIYKSNHPKITLEQLEKKFDVPTHTARYALQKFALEADLGKATVKGRRQLAEMMADDLNEAEVMRYQLNYCLAEMEINKKLALQSRIDLLYKTTRIRMHIQRVELESHLKRADAQLIANIIRRFEPDASDDMVVKIYNEELQKLREEYGTI